MSPDIAPCDVTPSGETESKLSCSAIGARRVSGLWGESVGREVVSVSLSSRLGGTMHARPSASEIAISYHGNTLVDIELSIFCNVLIRGGCRFSFLGIILF